MRFDSIVSRTKLRRPYLYGSISLSQNTIGLCSLIYEASSITHREARRAEQRDGRSDQTKETKTEQEVFSSSLSPLSPSPSPSVSGEFLSLSLCLGSSVSVSVYVTVAVDCVRLCFGPCVSVFLSFSASPSPFDLFYPCPLLAFLPKKLARPILADSFEASQ